MCCVVREDHRCVLAGKPLALRGAREPFAVDIFLQAHGRRFCLTGHSPPGRDGSRCTAARDRVSGPPAPCIRALGVAVRPARLVLRAIGSRGCALTSCAAII